MGEAGRRSEEGRREERGGSRKEGKWKREERLGRRGEAVEIRDNKCPSCTKPTSFQIQKQDEEHGKFHNIPLLRTTGEGAASLHRGWKKRICPYTQKNGR